MEKLGDSLFAPFVKHWFELAPNLLGPVTLVQRHPFLMAKLGLRGIAVGTVACESELPGRTDEGAVCRIGGAFVSRARRAVKLGVRR